MFTGIIETLGVVIDIKTEGTNRIFTIESPISKELKIDQSLSHNGVCLTVTDLDGSRHQVAAIKETLDKSNLGQLTPGDQVNLERSMSLNRLLDGHLVQGHIDATATCVDIKNADGSWFFTFRYDPDYSHLLVDKGSISINGVSLTLIDPSDDQFTVAIIPYTYQHTTFRYFEKGTMVNLEFDILGKYIWKQLSQMNLKK